MVISIKVRYGNQLRRFKATNMNTFRDLEGRLRSIFHLPNNFVIKYRDEEGDWINLETDEEWFEALENVAQNQILHLSVTDAPLSAPQLLEQIHEKIPGEIPILKDIYNTIKANAPETRDFIQKTLSDIAKELQAVSISKFTREKETNTETKAQQSTSAQTVPYNNSSNNNATKEFTLEINTANKDEPLEFYAEGAQPKPTKGKEVVKVAEEEEANNTIKRILDEAIVANGIEIKPAEVQPTEASEEDADWTVVPQNDQAHAPLAVPQQQEEEQQQQQQQQENEQVKVNTEAPAVVEEVIPIVEEQPAPAPAPAPAVEAPVVEEVPAAVEAAIEAPAPAPDVEAPVPAVEAPVQPEAKFIADVTIPDGSKISPGAPFIKTWRIKNTGSQQWPAGTRLRFIGGHSMYTQDTIPVKAAAPGEQVDISVSLVAPYAPGLYRSYFRLIDANDNQFGHKVWVEIDVPKVAPPPHTGGFFPFFWGNHHHHQQQPLPQPQPPMYLPPPQPQPVPQVIPQQYPAPQPQPQVSKWADKLATLAEMGFTDVDANVHLLNKYNGDLPRVVQDILGGN